MSFSSNSQESVSVNWDYSESSSSTDIYDSASHTNFNPTQMTVSFNSIYSGQDEASTSEYSLLPSVMYNASQNQNFVIEHTFLINQLHKMQFRKISTRRTHNPCMKGNDVFAQKTNLRSVSESMLYSISRSSMIRKQPIFRCPRWMSNLARAARCHNLRINQRPVRLRAATLPTITEETDEDGSVQNAVFELNNFAIQPYHSSFRTSGTTSSNIVNTLDSLSISSQAEVKIRDTGIEDICQRLHELPFPQLECDSINSLNKLFDVVKVDEEDLKEI